jgi:hypothetical protein
MLEREMPGFDWSRWAAPQGINHAGAVILAQPSFFNGFAALLQQRRSRHRRGSEEKGVQFAGAPEDRFYGVEAIMKDGVGN